MNDVCIKYWCIIISCTRGFWIWLCVKINKKWGYYRCAAPRERIAYNMYYSDIKTNQKKKHVFHNIHADTITIHDRTTHMVYNVYIYKINNLKLTNSYVYHKPWPYPIFYDYYVHSPILVYCPWLHCTGHWMVLILGRFPWLLLARPWYDFTLEIF